MSPANLTKTCAPWATTLATVLVAWWAHRAEMERVAVEKLKLKLELERRVNQVENMRSELYE
jgi:hypothetical protein